ncbi:PE-PGRS family protein [Variovorax sp. WDL1]|nr:PE-PGRS family protein [Variovorax sp. WDL1]
MHGEFAGAQSAVVADGDAALLEVGAAAVAVLAGERQRACAGLGQGAAAGEGVAKGLIAGLIDEECGVVGDSAAAEAGSTAGQGAGADGGATLVGVDACQRQQARAGLGQAAGPADRTLLAQRRARERVEGAAGRAERGGTVHGEVGGGPQCAAVEDEAPRGAAQVGIAGHGNNPRVEARAAGVGVAAGQGQGARAGLDQVGAALTPELAGRREISVGLQGAAGQAELNGAPGCEGTGGAQRATIDDQQGGRAQVLVCGNRQRAFDEDGSAGIGVGARQGQGTGTDLGKASAPVDRTLMDQRRACVCRDRPASQQRGGTVHREIGGGPQHAPIEEEAARGVAEVGVARHGNHAVEEERATGVGVGTGERQRAIAGLGERAGAADAAGIFGGPCTVGIAAALIEHHAGCAAARSRCKQDVALERIGIAPQRAAGDRPILGGTAVARQLPGAGAVLGEVGKAHVLRTAGRGRQVGHDVGHIERGRRIRVAAEPERIAAVGVAAGADHIADEAVAGLQGERVVAAGKVDGVRAGCAVAAQAAPDDAAVGDARIAGGGDAGASGTGWDLGQRRTGNAGSTIAAFQNAGIQHRPAARDQDGRTAMAGEAPPEKSGWIRRTRGAAGASDDAAGIDDAAAGCRCKADATIAPTATLATCDGRATVAPAASLDDPGVREARPAREQHTTSTAATAASASAPAVAVGRLAEACSGAARAARAAGNAIRIDGEAASPEDKAEAAAATTTASATASQILLGNAAVRACAPNDRAGIVEGGGAANLAAHATCADAVTDVVNPAISSISASSDGQTAAAAAATSGGRARSSWRSRRVVSRAACATPCTPGIPTSAPVATKNLSLRGRGHAKHKKESRESPRVQTAARGCLRCAGAACSAT